MLSLNEKIDVAELLMEYGDHRAGYLNEHYRNLHGDSESTPSDRQEGGARQRCFEFTLTKQSLFSPANVRSKRAKS